MASGRLRLPVAATFLPEQLDEALDNESVDARCECLRG
jgi:hypothetical protein